jgi:large subunit ribosomal protein L10
MNKERKAATVDEIAEQIQAAEAVFAVDYRGISVPQAADLRARLRDADASFRVVKNSLTERAADKAGAETLRELLEGPTALTFVRGDAALAAKALADFARAQTPIEFKGGLMGGEPVSIDEIKAIARLPARDVLFAQLVGTVASPLTGLARGLNGLLSGVAIQLQQIIDKGLLPDGGEQLPEAPAEEPAAEPAEEPPAEEEPAEEPPAEEEPAEEPAAEEEPAEEPAAEAPSGEPDEQADEADASAAADGNTDNAAEAKEEA